MGRYISTKLFENYSVALRQWRASHSHCELLHGYALKFKVWFESVEPLEENQLDEMNWIQDYGGFKSVPVGNGLKDWMDEKGQFHPSGRNHLQPIESPALNMTDGEKDFPHHAGRPLQPIPWHKMHLNRYKSKGRGLHELYR